MDPNNQPAQPQGPPQVPSEPTPTPAVPTPEAQPQFADSPVDSPATPPVSPPPTQPIAPTYGPANTDQSNMGYAAGAPASQEFDPNYLDSIAAAAPPPKFFSGVFGKVFFGMIALFVLAVSIIIAMSGKDNTADLQQIVVRLDSYSKVTKKIHPDLQSNNLKTTDSMYSIWAINSLNDGEALLKEAGVKKTQYDKKMVGAENKAADDLASKFENANLNARLDTVYARTMAAETDKLLVLYTNMSKHSKAKKIRDYAKTSADNLKPLQKQFADYVDDGRN